MTSVFASGETWARSAAETTSPVVASRDLGRTRADGREPFASPRTYAVRSWQRAGDGSPQTPPVTDDRALVEFLGYGPKNPTLLFLGYDEYCHLSALAINLEVRRNFPSRFDKNESCRLLEKACREAKLDLVAESYSRALIPGASVPTWTFAALFAQRFLARGLTWQKEYELLGSSGVEGRTFLTERYPLPRPSHWFEHPGRETRALTVQRRLILKQQLISQLKPGAVIVSYAGRPTDLVLGRMQRRGRRAWEPILASRHGNAFAEVSQTDKYPVLRVPFPRKGDQPWWEQWLDAAVDAIKQRVAAIALKH